MSLHLLLTAGHGPGPVLTAGGLQRRGYFLDLAWLISWKICQVDRGRVGVLLKRLQVLLDRLHRTLDRPQIGANDVQVLMM